MYASKKAQVSRFIIQESGTYEDQFRRPYTTQLDGTIKNNLMEQLSSGERISSSLISDSSFQFIRPSATPESMIDIVNGWGTKRLRFYLQIISVDHMGNTTSEHIVGYTDYTGISNNLYIDPHMVFYINAVNITRNITVSTALGRQSYSNLLDASHVLSDSSYTGAFSNMQKTYGLLPENIYQRMELHDIKNGNGLEGFALDARSYITNHAKKSNRTNNIAPVYTANILSSYMNGINQGDVDVTSAREFAASSVRSPQIASDPFLSFLREKHHAQSVNTFTMQDLIEYDSNTPNVTHVVPLNGSYANNVHVRGLTASWGSSDLTTQFAATLSQAIPSYMLQHTINKITIHSTNMDLSGTINTVVSNVKAFSDGFDMSTAIQAFIAKIDLELMRGLSMSGYIAYQVEMSVDLLGETWIHISLNGEPFVDYVCPSFADGLMAPIVTTNEQIVESIAHDFDNIIVDLSTYKSTYDTMMPSGII